MGIKSVVRRMVWVAFVLHGVALLSLWPGAGQTQTDSLITLDGSLGGTAGPVDSFGGIYFIDEGMGQTRGANLFHSFGAFNVGTGERAFFTGSSSIHNIIGRVTGGNPSHIDGTLESGIPGANLFLLNPAGVMFGANAMIDITGSFHVSTADVLRFKNGEEFHADLSHRNVSTLTMAPPAAFGFLHPNPAPIQIQGLVSNDASLSVIGGDLEIGKLVTEAPINIVSVGSPGYVAFDTPEPDFAFNVDHFEHLGEITTASGSTINIQGSRVLIRGGRLALMGGSMNAQPDGPGLGISIQIRTELVVDNVSIKTTPARGERAGDIEIKAGRLKITGRDALIASGTSEQGGEGQSGDIQIEAEHLTLEAGGRISASTNANTDAGTVTITAGEVRIAGAFGSKPSGIFSVSAGVSGEGGSIEMDVGTLIVEDGGVISASTMGQRRGGEVIIHAEAVRITGQQSSILSIAEAEGRGGDIAMGVGTLVIEHGGLISASTLGTGDAGNVNVMGRGENPKAQLVRLNSGKIIANTRDEDGGNITLQAESVVMGRSNMTADAIQGRGGFIQITSDVFLADPDSSVTAKSDDVRNNGEVDIRAPVIDLSGVVAPLPSSFNQVAALLNHRCATQLQEKSKSCFVLRGRDRVPFEPHQMLPSLAPRRGEHDRMPEVDTAGQARVQPTSARSQGTGDLSCARWRRKDQSHPHTNSRNLSK